MQDDVYDAVSDGLKVQFVADLKSIIYTVKLEVETHLRVTFPCKLQGNAPEGGTINQSIYFPVLNRGPLALLHRGAQCGLCITSCSPPPSGEEPQSSA